MAITILAAVRHEEGNMRAAFGDGYDAYLESRTAPRARIQPARALRIRSTRRFRARARRRLPCGQCVLLHPDR